MKYVYRLAAGIVTALFATLVVAAPASAFAPGCYLVQTPLGTLTQLPGGCRTLMALNPAFFPGTDCWKVTKFGTVYGQPVKFECTSKSLLPPSSGSGQKPAIPIGCPGSTLSGPVTKAQSDVCKSIPVGCPGSTQQGKPAANFNADSCQYAAATQSSGGTTTTTPPDNTPAKDPCSDSKSSENAACLGTGSKTCDGTDGKGHVVQSKLNECLTQNPLVMVFQDIINFLAIGVGVITVIMIIVGGIQYAAAGSNPQATAAAKKRIFNAVFAMVAFLLLYSFVQWLVPGGIF